MEIRGGQVVGRRLDAVVAQVVAGPSEVIAISQGAPSRLQGSTATLLPSIPQARSWMWRA
jgi:hypothetical protein